MENNQQQISFDLQIRGIKEAVQQTNTLRENIERLGKVKISKNPMKQMGEDTDSALMKLKTYESQLAAIRQKAARSFMSGDTAGFTKYKAEFDALNTKMVDFNKQFGIFNRGFFALGDNIQYFAAKARSHWNWLLTGAALAGVHELSQSFLSNAKEIEEQLGKTRQNMELSPQYHNNVKQLDADLEHLKNTAALFSVAYSADLREVMESMQLISRRYKDLPTIQLLENMVLTLHKLDFVPIAEGSRLIEAITNQFQLSAEAVKQFVNEVSVATHSYNILSIDLLAALQRSGSAMKQMNMGTRESIALISVLSNATSRTGGELGQFFKSWSVNLDYPKMKKALNELGISLYDAENKMRPGVDVLEEMFRAFGTMDEKSQNAFATLSGGGKWMANYASVMLRNADMIRDAYNKLGIASDELTASLLATRLDTYANRLEQLSASWKVFSTTVGYEALPAMKNLVWHLSEGLQALNNHREEVSRAVNGIVLLGEAFLLSKSSAWLLNSAVGAGSAAIGGMAGQAITAQLAAGNLKTAIVALAANFGGLAAGVAGAAGRLVVFIGLAQLLNNLIGGYQADNAAKDMEQRIHDERKHADRGGLSEDTRQEIELLNKRNELMAKQKEMFFSGASSTLNPEYRRINNELDSANGMIASRNRIAGQMALIRKVGEIDPKATVLKDEFNKSGDDFVDFGKGKGNSGGSRDQYKLENVTIQREMNDLFTQAKLSADRYQESLDNLSLQERLYGNTIENSISSITLLTQRQAQLSKEQEAYNKLADTYKAAAQEMIDKDSSITEVMQQYGLTLKDLGKEEYRTLIQDNNHLNKLLDSYNRLTEAASRAGKEANKLKNDLTYAKLGKISDLDNRLQRRIQGNQSQTKWDESLLDKTSLSYSRDAQLLKLKEATFAYQEYSAALKKAEKDLQNLIETGKAQPATLDQQERKVEELKNSTASAFTKMKDAAYQYGSYTKQFMADTFVDLIVEGNTFEQVFTKIIKQVAKEAIYAMLGIQQQASMFNVIGGKGKGKGVGGITGVTGSSSALRATTSNNLFKTTWHDGGVIPRFHSGAVIPYLKNDELPAILQQGEEVVSRKDRATNEMLVELVKTMAQNQSNNVIQISAIDSKSFVEYADAHGDALVNLLRKQKSMGNAI